jgi:anaerobic selenocysteine-containing dehydrogenase
VVHDTHWTKTADYADVVLPAPTYLEKDDLHIPWTHNLVGYAPQVVVPITDSRREIWVMQALANRLGLKEAWLYEDPWQAVERALKDAFEDGDVRTLKSGATLRLQKKQKHRYATPSGKIELYSSQALANGFMPLPVQTPLPRAPGQFIYLTSASPHYTSTQFQEVYGAIPATVVLNLLDAKRLAIEDGEVVMLSNERGSVTMKASVADIVPEGVVWSPRQFEGLNGEPQNCLMSSVPQTIGKGPRFHSTTITITKVA